MLNWSLSKDGSNHPSIAQRGVSCSKVGLRELKPSKGLFYLFWKQILVFTVILENILYRIFDCWSKGFFLKKFS